MKSLKLLVLLQIVIVKNLALVNNNLQRTTKLVQTAVNVANSVYKHHFITSVAWNDTEFSEVNNFLINFRGTVYINPVIPKYKIMKNAVGAYNQTVFLAKSIMEFENFITAISKNLRYSIYLILVLTFLITEETQLSEVFNRSWTNNLVDVIAISANRDDEITLSTYFPYTEGTCTNFTPVVLKRASDLFSTKKFNNFYRCPIKTTLLHFLPYLDLEKHNGTVTSIRGTDGEMIMLVIEALNGSVSVVSSRDHGGFGTFSDGVGTGSFGDLLNLNADIVLPAGIIIHKRYLVSQISHAYHVFDIYWCGPTRREIYSWAKVFLPFFSNITPFLCLSFTVFVIVTFLVKKFKPHKCESRDGVFFQSFVIFLGQAVDFTTSSKLINSLYVLWIWFCFIVRIAYQGDLIDGMGKDILEAPLGTIEEAVKHVNGIGGAEVVKEFYRDTPIGKKYEVLPLVDIPIILKDITKGKRYVLATDMIIIRPLRHNLQVLQKPITHATTCFYMRPRWPAAKKVDRTIQRLLETGFLENIMNKNDQKLKRRKEGAREATSLNMAVLGALLYGLAIMWVVCILLFAIEILYFKFKLRKHKSVLD